MEKEFIKFNPENKESLTNGECLAPAVEITDPINAKQYFDDYVKYIQRFLDKEPNEDGYTAEEIAKKNLGYFAGYYDYKTQSRVNELFCTSHPVFGDVVPTIKEAFDTGVKFAKKEGGLKENKW